MRRRPHDWKRIHCAPVMYPSGVAGARLETHGHQGRLVTVLDGALADERDGNGVLRRGASVGSGNQVRLGIEGGKSRRSR
ncbi:MAG: hypothetical protein LH650_06985 [Chloroflexi bacterium]|nr:hypothetical protein [Chloroflexota bacterium]